MEQGMMYSSRKNLDNPVRNFIKRINIFFPRANRSATLAPKPEIFVAVKDLKGSGVAYVAFHLESHYGFFSLTARSTLKAKRFFLFIFLFPRFSSQCCLALSFNKITCQKSEDLCSKGKLSGRFFFGNVFLVIHGLLFL